mmetsp:Transcript_66570/g.205868  ORF Transcript_66570/g.205868 Transcript_66570/m.205868 type:complete len:260 (-) Transcript_66570:210-989(-)
MDRHVLDPRLVHRVADLAREVGRLAGKHDLAREGPEQLAVAVHHADPREAHGLVVDERVVLVRRQDVHVGAHGAEVDAHLPGCAPAPRRLSGLLRGGKPHGPSRLRSSRTEGPLRAGDRGDPEGLARDHGALHRPVRPQDAEVAAAGQSPPAQLLGLPPGAYHDEHRVRQGAVRGGRRVHAVGQDAVRQLLEDPLVCGLLGGLLAGDRRLVALLHVVGQQQACVRDAGLEAHAPQPAGRHSVALHVVLRPAWLEARWVH